jgi:hypothetical protein
MDGVRAVEIAFPDLEVTANAIREIANVPRDLPSVSELIEEVATVVRVRAGYRRLDALGVDVPSGRVEVPGGAFRPGRIIAPQLRGASAAVLLVVTLGPGFDAWSGAFFDRGDPYLGFLADTIGSVAAEAAAECTQQRIEAELRDENLRATRRFSPGYCGWDVVEQRILFSLLPDGFCGVALTDSAFMTPVKSVSALIGVGPEVTKEPYPCRRCDVDDCPNRKDGP